MAATRFRMSRRPNGIGCTIGLTPGLYVGATGSTPADALSQAGHLAAQLLQLAKDHPEVGAAMKLVPGGAEAMAAMAIAAKLYDTPGVSKQQVQEAVGGKIAKVVESIINLF